MDILSSIASMTNEMSVARFAIEYASDITPPKEAATNEVFDYALLPSRSFSAAILAPPQFIDTYA